MKLILIGDLHGKLPKIKKQHLKDCKAIINCGDFCDAKTRKYKLDILRLRKKDPKTKTQWFGLIGKKKAWKLIKSDLNTGRKALKKLNKYNIPVFIIPGNGDYYAKDRGWGKESKNYYNTYLIKNLKNIHNCHNKLLRTPAFDIVGYGISSAPELPNKKQAKYIPKTKLKRKQTDYNQQLKLLNKIFKKAKKPTILLSHNVPYNTKIDKILWKESPACGEHYGSIITRKIIEKHNKKILFCVAGHMHEHFRKIMLKGTTCINSGAGYEEKYVVMEIDGNKIKSMKFIK